MRKIAALTFLTLDGVMQGPSSPEEDTSNGFTQGGWAAPYWDEVMAQVLDEAMAEPYDLLLGRTTYMQFAEHFPGSVNPVADILNRARKYVVTSSASVELPWDNTIRITGNLEESIQTLKQQNGPLLQVHGSSTLLRFLLARGLVDELRLWTFPVLAGTGKRLFDNQTLPRTLSFVKTATTSGGVCMTVHRQEP